MAEIKRIYNEDYDIAVFNIKGIITYPEMKDIIDVYYGGQLTKYTIFDFTEADVKQHFTTHEAQLLGGQVQRLGITRKNAVDVIIVPDLFQYGLARIYAAYSEMVQTSDSLRTMIFRSKESAMDWIKKNESK